MRWRTTSPKGTASDRELGQHAVPSADDDEHRARLGIFPGVFIFVTVLVSMFLWCVERALALNVNVGVKARTGVLVIVRVV